MCGICKARPFATKYVDGKWLVYCWDGHLMAVMVEVTI